MGGVTFSFRNPPEIFQQLQQNDTAHFIPPSLAVCEYHWRSLMICATGNYSILLVSLENASKVPDPSAGHSAKSVLEVKPSAKQIYCFMEVKASKDYSTT